ncbi:PREDICTED: trypsin-5 [Papilio xuthus]|uniref:Trypsin-5 n=1 Tax=Papilio xuthus TaxID=66420 RepID=A0AAJ7E9G3_PAPXU|nr:PREDICTED: trypsin-5 [Papilio xuthus]
MNAIIFIIYTSVLSYQFLPERELFYSPINLQRTYTPNLEEVPHHVLIIYSNLFCSGSLVSSITVVTAASCFWKNTDEKVMVKIGSNILSDGENIYNVDSIKIHEYYKHLCDTDNDIALLLLKNHVSFSKGVKKVILVEPETVLRENTAMTVSGWSTSKLTPKVGNVLLWTEMVVINRKDCVQNYGGLITPSNFCAKYNLGRRLFDNGGPAVYQDLLVGILSFGNAEPKEPYLAVFTNISYFYRWIMLNTKRFLRRRCETNQESEYNSYSYEYAE